MYHSEIWAEHQKPREDHVKIAILLSPIYLEECQPQSSNNECVFIKLCIMMIERYNSDIEA